MFVESQGEPQGRVALWREDFARRHPRAFTAALILLALGVAVGLMFDEAAPTVLYQGF